MDTAIKTALGGAAGFYAMMSSDPYLAWCLMFMIFWHKLQADMPS